MTHEEKIAKKQYDLARKYAAKIHNLGEKYGHEYGYTVAATILFITLAKSHYADLAVLLEKFDTLMAMTREKIIEVRSR
jgi:hypothetical protein